jgi:hypothetical protein
MQQGFFQAGDGICRNNQAILAFEVSLSIPAWRICERMSSCETSDGRIVAFVEMLCGTSAESAKHAENCGPWPLHAMALCMNHHENGTYAHIGCTKSSLRVVM